MASQMGESCVGCVCLWLCNFDRERERELHNGMFSNAKNSRAKKEKEKKKKVFLGE